MTKAGTRGRVRVTDVMERYGKCLDIVPMDRHFNDISVGLYVKNDICTVWTFSRKPGVVARIERIRDQIVSLGGLAGVEGHHDQFSFPCGQLHARPLRFLLAHAVGKDPDYSPPQDMSIRDTRTRLTLSVDGSDERGRWVYRVAGRGEAPNIPMRLRAIVAGFVRYGELDKISDTGIAFRCGRRHDELIRIVMPYSRNVSAVESKMDKEAQRGQMTTGTLGFTPT